VPVCIRPLIQATPNSFPKRSIHFRKPLLAEMLVSSSPYGHEGEPSRSMYAPRKKRRAPVSDPRPRALRCGVSKTPLSIRRLRPPRQVADQGLQDAELRRAPGVRCAEGSDERALRSDVTRIPALSAFQQNVEVIVDEGSDEEGLMVELRVAVDDATRVHGLMRRLSALFGRSAIALDRSRREVRVESEWESRAVVQVIDAPRGLDRRRRRHGSNLVDRKALLPARRPASVYDEPMIASATAQRGRT
jgi:hypothetical protein